MIRKWLVVVVLLLVAGVLIAIFWAGGSKNDLTSTTIGSSVSEGIEGITDLPVGGSAPTGLEGELPAPERPWIALIIDDFGPVCSAVVVPGFLELSFDLTISVIPGNPKTVSIGRAVEAAGRELFIHLPMEPNQPVAMDERDMVLVGMDSLALHTILERVQGELPSAVGMNNHMGSRATSDEALMRLLATELKRRGMTFVDSRTVAHSRGYPAMKVVGVPVLRRDVFIDNVRESERIREQLARLVHLARRRGWALGIGHADPVTLEVLTEELPSLVASGVRIVSAGRLTRTVWDMRRKEITDTGIAASSMNDGK